MIEPMTMMVEPSISRPFALASLLARAAEIVLVVVIAILAAKAVWFAIYGAETLPGDMDVRANAARPVETIHTDLSVLGETNLFRTRADLADAPSNLSAPETRLNLTLRGVRTGTTPQSGSAVIEAPNIGQRTLAVGGEIAEGVTLEEIYPDRVIINRRGARESLFLREDTARRSLSLVQPASTTPVSAPDPAPKTPSRATPASDPMSRLTGTPNVELASELEAEDWIDGLRLSPSLQDGAMQGFQVRENTRLEVFQASGLLPGDIVTALNGVPLDSPDGAREAIELFLSADRAEFDVLRDGQTVTLSLPLGEG